MTRPLLRHTVVVSVLVFGLAASAAVAHAQNPPETIEYYATDALGSVRVVFTATGQVIGRSDYLPFGDTLEQIGMLPRQRFTGQERDGVAGLDDFNARSLQMRTGRMNRPDALFGNALVNPQRWNGYSYVVNNPLGFVDPSGNQEVPTPVFRAGVTSYSCALTNCVTRPPEQMSDAALEGSLDLIFGGEGKAWYESLTGTSVAFFGRHGDGKVPAPPTGGAANDRTPQPPTKTQERLERLRSCALGYYGIDPLSMSGATSNGAKWGLIALSAGGIPKSVAAKIGLRVIMQPGASEYTSALSMFSLATGGGGSLRTIANFGSKWAGPIAIASAAIDATAIGICTAWD